MSYKDLEQSQCKFDGCMRLAHQNRVLAEMLKTPGRRKNAPARTRSAVAASARKEAVITMSLDVSTPLITHAGLSF